MKIKEERERRREKARERDRASARDTERGDTDTQELERVAIIHMLRKPFFLGRTLHQKSESWALIQEPICFEFLFIVCRHLILTKDSHGGNCSFLSLVRIIDKNQVFLFFPVGKE